MYLFMSKSEYQAIKKAYNYVEKGSIKGYKIIVDLYHKIENIDLSFNGEIAVKMTKKNIERMKKWYKLTIDGEYEKAYYYIRWVMGYIINSVKMIS